MKTTIAALAAAVALAACAVQPAQHSALPDTVASTAPTAWDVRVDTSPLAADAWWQQFGDPTLHALVSAVLAQNLDVQAAVERVKQAQQVTIEKRAALLPQLDLNAIAAEQRQITPPPLGYVREAGIGVTAAWQPDVFGGQRLALLAARAQVEHSQDAVDALKLALAANTASAYIDLRWAQSEQAILQNNIEIRTRALKLTQERRAYGLSNNLDVARAQNQLSDLQARLPRVASTIQHQLSLIAVYSGRTPESVDTLLLANAAAIPVPAGDAPALLPSEALLRRPDVRVAYDTVEQRAAEVGVSRARRYPQFNLQLTDGLLAASWVGLPTVTDNLFGAALSATSPIFHAGEIQAGIESSESKMRESELNLHQTMLDALKEVEDTRSDLVSTGDEVTQLGTSLAASDQALKLSNELYRGGAANFLDVLDAQEAYLRDQDALNQARREHALAAVALYRSLGGGWSRDGRIDVAHVEQAPQTPQVAQASQRNTTPAQD
ncbi:efflux transporter outer membrane subunit [Pararobbsia silviterrae]|uniref:Efflux transporter outer membrane subunit n=1 Tax=Pararobbsia silviterrae TaxID=1792498 RepID=A0A494XNC5_9BURK|nr:efflux transporter outer membrane subunit [Pararobbsia silviterrae]RKP49584.1 efflux transporter outer membrane subunit [Pararobbsia silviterrae]